MKTLLASVTVLALASVASPQAARPAKPSTPAGAAFDKLKSPAGEGEGTMNDGGQQMAATTSFRLVSDGSALMNILGSGTPYEMVTMFHMDNSDLLATHYCGSHNQPRFRMLPSSDPNVIDF